MLLLIYTLPTLSVLAAGSPGQIEINKTAVISGVREYTVNLTVKGNGLTTTKKTDIVLVLDRSASMAWEFSNDTNPEAGEKSRMTVLKEAANNFVDDVLAAGLNNRVAVVSYSGNDENDSAWNDSQTLQAFSSSASTVKASYASLTPNGGTNMQAGFLEAAEVMPGVRADADQIVIFMTDGIPTFHYNASGMTQGPGGSFDTAGRDNAIAAAEALKAAFPAAKIYTIGLNISDPVGQIASVLNPIAPHDYPEEYYQVTTADGLNAIYESLSEIIITQIATDAVVTDAIRDGFTIIPGSIVAPAGTTAVVNGTPPAAEIITWTIGNVAQEVLTLTYRLRAEDPVYGSGFTNEYANISFKPVAENTFYPAGTTTLVFPKPDVPVPPIAVDDAYSVNAGSVLNVPVPGVLANDISAIQLSEGGWTSTPISGSVAVVTPPANGLLVQNPNGSLTYTPNPGFAGVDTYVYQISSILTKTGASPVTLSDTATVTITCKALPKYTVTKVWADNNDAAKLRPSFVQVQLKQNNVPFGALVTLNSDNSWSHTYTDLPVGDQTPFVYTVEESTVLPAYTTTYSQDTFTITNTLRTVAKTVIKVWADSNDAAKLRPTSVQVQLYQGAAAYGAPVTLNSGNSWSHTFTDLPAGGETPFVYTVKELTVLPAYTTAYSQDTFTITNTLVKNRIKIIKLDGRDERTLLSGAIFELHAAVAGNPNPTIGALLEALTTDVNGQAITTGSYAPGTYFLVETKEPTGFLKLNEPVRIDMAVGSGVEGLFTVRIYNDFDNNPAITISKMGTNLDRPGSPADLTALYVGETVRYTIKITNNGNTLLSDILLTDDMALVGSDVKNVTAGTTIKWLSGTEGIATLNLGDLAAGASIDLTYDYDTVEADLAREPITNTATVTGQLGETPDYPNGTTVSKNDTAMITVDNTPLSVSGLAITKLVENITSGNVPADLAGGIGGNVFRYTITIANTGNLDLSLVTLTDDQAPVGGTVHNVTASTDTTWIAGTGGIATLNIGDLAAGESMIFTYDLNTTVADNGTVLVNLATVKGTVTITLDDPEVIVISDEDTATIMIDEIPLTGETGAASMAGMALLLGAAALVIFRKRQSNRE